MEVIPLLIFLAIFCQNAIAAKKDLQFSSLILDLTRPVNELFAKEITQRDFRSDVHAAFNLIGGNMTTFTIFYATAGNTIEEFESRTQDACNILKETLNIDSDTQLLISWKSNGTTIDALNFTLLYNHTFYRCTPKIVLQFNEDSGCDGIRDLPNEMKELLDSNNGMFVGVSYDESLHSCPALGGWKYFASIIVVNLKFGTSRGVTESFGLFEIRMKFLSKTVEYANSDKLFLYYPNPHSVGKDEHQNLLVRYASIWTTSSKTRGSILVQVPNSRNKVSEMAQFSIIPMFRLQGQSTSSPDEDILSSLLLFIANFQRPQMFLVNSRLWKLWNSLSESNIRPPQLRNVVSSIDLCLDCTIFDCNNLNGTSHQLTPLNEGNKATIVIEVKDVGLPSLPTEIAKQTTPKLTIGCKYRANYFQRLNESNVERVVRSCQSINGSVYILLTTIRPEDHNELGKYSFFFENTIRKELHAVNRFRNGIMGKVPSAKVYFQLYIQQLPRPTIWVYPNLNSLFCGELVPAVNLYFEAIFNWAKLENFPVSPLIWKVRKTFLSPKWGTLLRRLNYPYPEWTVTERGEGQMQSSNVSSPAFLMQDYLKSIHNWEPDACIDWTERRWEITEDFFYNPKTGTVFHPSSILNNRSLTEHECMIMFQFVFYRFRLVEIIISFNFANLLAAIEHKMASGVLNAEIFVKYAMTEHEKNLSEFISFIDQLRKMFEKGLLKGVHAELVLESRMSNGENISNLSNFQSVLSMMRYAKRSNITCGLELRSVKMCNQMLQTFIFNDIYVHLFGTINYLVIKETFTGKYHKWKLEDLLDSHLALKRSLNLLIPHLRVYFRVELDFEINYKNNVELDGYTSFLALLKTFGTQHDIGYFVGVAFDGQSLPKQNGWWGIQNYSDLNNPQSYVEKVTVSRGYPMRYPANLPALQSITVSNSQDVSLVIIVSSVSSAVLFLFVIVGIGFGLRYRKLQRLTRFLSDSEVQEFLNGRGCSNTEPATTEMELMGSVEYMKFNEEYKLALPDLIIDFNKILGSGAFGTVYHGLTNGVPAAIKRPNGDCSKSTFKSVLTEVKVLSFVGKHPNVVGFLGSYVEEIYKGVLYISTELCALGSLESFLRKKKNVTSEGESNLDQSTELDGSVLYFRDLNTFALEIAKGMEYIESRRVVHGDLSTRNVLLDENLVCKIGDFGLSRKLYEYQKYVKSSQEPLPWKWMAPESLTKMEFTSKTDLWSYGITLWEIYTLGNIPYSGLNWSVDFAKEIKNGLRLPSPDFASPEIYAKLLECWSFNPDDRPTFADMIKFFNGFTEDAYMILNPIEEQHESTIEN